MVIRNLMTGSGYIGGAYSSEWITAWLVIGILGTFAFLGKKVLHDNMDYPFNLAGSLIGVLLAIIIVTFTGWNKIAFVVGLAGMVGGAFFLDQYLGGG